MVINPQLKNFTDLNQIYDLELVKNLILKPNYLISESLPQSHYASFLELNSSGVTRTHIIRQALRKHFDKQEFDSSLMNQSVCYSLSFLGLLNIEYQRHFNEYLHETKIMGV